MWPPWNCLIGIVVGIKEKRAATQGRPYKQGSEFQP
jgi:hypothetical protein